MRSQVLTRVLTLVLFVLCCNHAIKAQIYDFPAPGAKWDSINIRWQQASNPTISGWTITPRTGLRDEYFPFFPNWEHGGTSYNCPTAQDPNRKLPYPCWAENQVSTVDSVTRRKDTKYYISDYVQGYLEYLPEGYFLPENSGKTYPLIIYFPGCGEMGGGTLFTHTKANGVKVPNYQVGMGRLMAAPATRTYTVPNSNPVRTRQIPVYDLFNSLPRELLFNGDYFSNIPLKTPGQAPPVGGWPKQGVIIMACVISGRNDVCVNYARPTYFDIPAAIDVAINPAKANYRVDRSRIYVTGMSAGAGISWNSPATFPDVARSIAAIVPVAAVDNIFQNDKTMPTSSSARNIINNGMNVLVICNDRDNSGETIQENKGSFQQLLNVPGIRPGQAASSFFTYDNQGTGNEHNAWSWAYRSRNSPEAYTGTIDSLGPVKFQVRQDYYPYRDPVTNEGYTTYEWMLTKQNLLLLPAQITAFTASRVNQGVQVSWTTAQEINTSHFVLERSTDGVKFEKLIEKPSAGNSNVKRDYGHLDAQLPTTQYVYYRLTQVDRDGKSTITGVRKVYIGNSGFEVSIYPNVATSNINLDIQGLVNEALTVRVIDVAGRPLMQQVIAPRQNRVNLDVSKLSKGMYMVQVTGTAKNVVVKFIKQ